MDTPADLGLWLSSAGSEARAQTGSASVARLLVVAQWRGSLLAGPADGRSIARVLRAERSSPANRGSAAPSRGAPGRPAGSRTLSGPVTGGPIGSVSAFRGLYQGVGPASRPAGWRDQLATAAARPRMPALQPEVPAQNARKSTVQGVMPRVRSVRPLHTSGRSSGGPCRARSPAGRPASAHSQTHLPDG